MIIRPAVLDDIHAIAAIYAEAVLTTTATADEEPPPRAQREAWLRVHQCDGYPVFVAEIEEQIVGWGSLSPYHVRAAYRFTAEDSVYVAEHARGRGVGRALLAPLVATARSMGLHSLMALIEGSNEASLRLHERFGFVRVGLAPQVMFKFERWLDVALLQLRLNP
jgi:phosphinothricin acetyltransferase